MRVRVQASYEELRRDTPSTLIRVIRELAGLDLDQAKATEVAHQYSFEQVKKQADAIANPGAELSFVRKGSLGDWREHFTAEAEEIWLRITVRACRGWDIVLEC